MRLEMPTCRRWICKTEKTQGGNWAIWQCPKAKVVFGLEVDWKAGKHQPKGCKNFTKRGD